jgi:hypothetical protein
MSRVMSRSGEQTCVTESDDHARSIMQELGPELRPGAAPLALRRGSRQEPRDCGNIWRASALNKDELRGCVRGMNMGYCSGCGSYTTIDGTTKWCDRCYRSWLRRMQLRG